MSTLKFDVANGKNTENCGVSYIDLLKLLSIELKSYVVPNTRLRHDTNKKKLL